MQTKKKTGMKTWGILLAMVLIVVIGSVIVFRGKQHRPTEANNKAPLGSFFTTEVADANGTNQPESGINEEPTWVSRLEGKIDGTASDTAYIAGEISKGGVFWTMVNNMSVMIEGIDKNVGSSPTGLSLHDKIGEPPTEGDTLFDGHVRIEKAIEVHDNKVNPKLDKILAACGKNCAGTIPAPKSGGPKTDDPAVGGNGQSGGAVVSKDCMTIIKNIAGSKGDKCEKSYRLIHEAGLECFKDDPDARARIDQASKWCESHDEKGLRKVANTGYRSFRELSGWNGVNRSTGKDMHNGWESNEGGDWVGFVYNGVKLWTVTGQMTKIGAKNLPGDIGEGLTKVCDDVFNLCEYSSAYPDASANGSGGGGSESGLIGAGEPGSTSYENTLDGTDMDIHTSQLTTYNGVGDTGKFGTSHPLALGSGNSADSTLPSNLTSQGYSSGMTQTSGTKIAVFEEGTNLGF